MTGALHQSHLSYQLPPWERCFADRQYQLLDALLISFCCVHLYVCLVCFLFKHGTLLLEFSQKSTMLCVGDLVYFGLS